MDWNWPKFQDTSKIEKMRNQETDKRFYKKSYQMPSGKIVMVQGNEDKALTKLLMEYDETNIIVGDEAITNAIGIIYYKGLDGKQHRYYPDIFIRSENMIIEVKSPYTYKLQEKTNELKKAACLSSGHRFKFMMF